MTRLASFAQGIAMGARPEDVAAELASYTDPPQVQAMINVLQEYGHDAWARDRARTLASVLVLDVELDVDEAHEMLRRVNGGDPKDRYVVPRPAAEEVLRAWRLGAERCA